MTDTISGAQGTTVNQADYLKLFMQELTYQDPLKPIDNREFMAQMAQFSALQEAQATNSSLALLANLVNNSSHLMLIGKKVTLKGSTGEYTVNKIEFVPNSVPLIHLLAKDTNLTVQSEDIASVS